MNFSNFLELYAFDDDVYRIILLDGFWLSINVHEIKNAAWPNFYEIMYKSIDFKSLNLTILEVIYDGALKFFRFNAAILGLNALDMGSFEGIRCLVIAIIS